jgi:4-amino-4-deoxy-L-arabinose transferase-like glycosyltransferase
VVSLTSSRLARRSIPVALLLIAGALRFWDLAWALPERIGLHPDETEHVMAHALAISFADPDPHFLNYPSLLIYLIAMVSGLLSHLGLVTETWQSYAVARGIVATFGTATAPAAYWLGAELGATPFAAGLGALFVAILPLHVWESHFAVTDVVMTFWIVVVLAGSVRLLRRAELVHYVAVGAALGLAVASKYTAALAMLSPLVATLLARPRVGTMLRNLAALGLAAAALCFVATPFSFIHFGQLRTAMAYEYQHVHSLHYGFSLPAVGWQYHKYVYELCAGFPFSLGFALWAATAGGAIWALATLRRETIVVLAFVVPFFAILGHWTFTPLRYMLPVLIVGAVFAGFWLGRWIEEGRGWQRAFATTAAVVTFGYTLAFTLSTTARLGHDTRIEAAHWLDQTVRPGSTVLICGFSPYMALPTNPKIHLESVNEVEISRLATHTEADLVEISSLHFWRYERHQHPAFDPEYRRFRSGEKGFHLVKRFDGEFLNRDLYRRLDPMFAGYFVSPTLEFYEPDTRTATG